MKNNAASTRQNVYAAIFRRLIVSWITAATAEYLCLSPRVRALNSLVGLSESSMLRLLILTGIIFLFLSVMSVRFHTQKIERWLLPGSVVVLTAASLYRSFSFSFLAACCLLLAVIVIYALRGWDSSPKLPAAQESGSRTYLSLTVIFSILFFLLISLWTVCRVICFSTPTYDFGIFSQMFYYMKTTGLPLTTLERDGLLSHFNVHVSPIYYLFLPFYCLFPYPATLQVLQAAVITSSVIPLWKLGKTHGLSTGHGMLLCTMLLLYPAFAGGVSFDLHENCFLTPLILWLFYGIDRKSRSIVPLAALLILMVKEDAPVYVAVIALWLLVRSFLHRLRWERFAGILLLSGSLLWFFIATGYLANVGDGVMTYRYDNFIYDGSSSLFAVVKAVFLCPMKVVYECADPEKIRFITTTMLPLLGIPLLTRRYERYILLIPYILVNLMSDYPYQHDIFFQYSFGSTACLFYLTLINLADLRIHQRRTLTVISSAILFVLFCDLIVPTAVYDPVNAITNRSHYQEISQALSRIPDDASVTASTFYTTYLSQRNEIYDVGYASKKHLLSTEYVVLSVNEEDSYRKYQTGDQSGYDSLMVFLQSNGYELFEEVENTLVILKR